jgi:hypothetical protein
MVVAFLVLARMAFRGWIPHDDGTLGQAATRVMAGQIPHVDFHDTYGGLQAYAHAGVFQVLGESVRSLRIANLVMAAIAGYSSFVLIGRIQPVVVAASVVATMWIVGFAVYPASLPSWWNSALGLAAACLVIRWLDTRNRLVLISAGLLTGLSFLVKSTGAYVGVAIALYFLMLGSLTSSRRRALVALGWGVVLAFGALLTSAASIQAFVFLLAPLLIVVAVGFRVRSRELFTNHRAVSLQAVVTFAVSALVPVALYVIPYIWFGNAQALLTGWIRLPRLRFDDAAWAIAVSPAYSLMLGVLGLLILWAHRIGLRVAHAALAAIIVVIALFHWTAWWGMVVTLIVAAPLVVSGGALVMDRRGSLTREHLLGACLLATFAFIQFPASNRIYAIYLVPWVVVALAVWIIGSYRAWALATILLLGSSIVAIQLERGYLYVSTPLPEAVELVPLDLGRGGIDVPIQHRFYADLVRHLDVDIGSAIYAGPDAPEVYFLSAALNPTPVLFDFLADDWNYGDLAGLVTDDLSAVVVNRSPEFSSDLPPAFLEIVEDEFPDRTSFGRFDIYKRPG